jgi:Arc/MetJ-type ribon-helix-helix transcriptional regulator
MSKPHTTQRSDEQPRTVEIPPETAAALSERLSRTEFDSVDEYVAFALDQLLYELERVENDGSDTRHVDGGSSEERSSDDAVSGRLESLGYL